MMGDLPKGLHFLVHVAITNEHRDTLIWSDSYRRVHLVEPTVPWEGNFKFANEWKRTRYEPSRANCETEAGPAALNPLKSVAVASSLDRPCPFCQHRTIQVTSVINHQLAPREGSIQLCLAIITQCFTYLGLHWPKQKSLH